MGGVAMNKDCENCRHAYLEIENSPNCAMCITGKVGEVRGWEPVPPTGIEAMVCQDIADRQALGIKKYGTTLADNPLELKEWLEHQYLELLDAALYCKRAIVQIETNEESK
jgi:hypothetical protein